MIAFNAFLDESEAPSNGPKVFVVAGAFAEPELWSALAEKWRDQLSIADAPYFHATDLESSQGDFKGWPRWKRIGLQDALIKAIREAPPIAFGAAIVLNDYRSLSAEHRSALGTPFEFCAQWAVRALQSILDHEPWVHDDGQVHYVFDQRPPRQRGRLDDAFRRALRNCPERRLAGPVWWGDKKETVELQVADMIAYEAAKDALRHLGVEEKNRARRTSMLALEGAALGKIFLVDRTKLLNAIRLGRTDVGKSDLDGMIDLANAEAMAEAMVEEPEDNGED